MGRSRPAEELPDTRLALRLRLGVGVWVLVAAIVVLLPAAGLTLVEAVVLLGPLVLGPLGLALLRPEPGDASAGWHRFAEVAQAPAALAATLAVLTPRGVGMAGVLAAVWLAVAVVAAAGPALAWLRAPTLDPAPLARTAALVFLVVGAAWLVIDRMGARPLGLSEDLVTLTAVHFHFAGFATATITSLTASATGTVAPRLTRASTWMIVGGPLLIATGFSAVAPLLLVGAVVLTAGLYLLSWLLLRHARPVDRLARGLLVLAAVAVIAPMVLAVQWAAGNVLGTPALSVPDMARTHGVVNAFGFAIPGLLGWLRARPPVG